MKQFLPNFISFQTLLKIPENNGNRALRICSRNYRTLILIFTILFLGFTEGSKLQAQTTIVGWSGGFSFEFTDNSTYWWNPYANLGISGNQGVSKMLTFGGVSHASSSSWFTDNNSVIYNNNTEGGTWANGSGTKGWTFSCSTIGYTSLKFSGKMSGTYAPSISWYGPRDFKLQYSLDNSTWTDVSGGSIAAAMDNNTAYANMTSLSNLSLPVACENKSVVYFRMLMTSNTSVDGTNAVTAGNSILDDFIVTGTPLPIAPTVTTSAVTNINATTATGNGNITSLGSPNPTAHGVCWNTTGTPLISDSKTDKGSVSVTGAFNTSITGLTANTTYYVRAYATNTEGTSYGTQVSFTTTATPLETEFFEDETAGTSVFTNNGFTFNITGSKFKIANTPGYGWSGTNPDDFYVDNIDNLLTAAGVIGSFKIQAATFKVKDLYVFPSVDGLDISNAGTVIIRGKLNGTEQFAQTIESAGINTNFGVNNGYTFVDLSANSSVSIDELEFEVTGSLKYLGIDAFRHHSIAAPYITSVSAPANGTYKTGDNLDFTINYSEAITVNTSGGTPYLPITLNTGGTVNASYISGNGTSSLVFRYTVAAGNLDTDGVSIGSSISPNGSTLKNSGGIDANLTLTNIASTANVKVDAVAPTATILVNDTALRLGETSLVTFTFSEAVTGFTTADLTVANGTVSGLSSSDGGITWTATLTPNSSTTDATNVITLDNSGIMDSAGNAGTGNTASTNYAIDTVRPTLANSITISDTALKIGDLSTITFSFTEAITGFTTADLTVANGTVSGLSSSDGGITWTATLTPTASIEDVTNIITLDYSGIADLAGNAGSGSANSGNYAIDTTRPTLVSSITISDTSLKIGDLSTITFTFTEPVTGFTTADLTVANGTVSGLSSSDGGMIWTATLTPSASIEDATNVITLDYTGIADLAGNTGSGSATSGNYAVDTLHPTISNVTSSTVNGTYKLGDVISITVTFSEAITVTGTPTLALNSSGTASYTSGSGTTVLTFSYTVGNGESSIDLDYSNTSAMAFAGGTIMDAIGNDAIITLPPVGGVSSIGGQKDIVIMINQIITFNSLTAKTYGDIDFDPIATASSGLTVSLSTSDSNVATIEAGKIHIVGTGTCTIYANQLGNDVYLPADQVSQTFTVNKATLTITADAQTKLFGAPNPALTFQYSGWKNSDTETVLDTKPVASTTVSITTSPGTYANAITVSGGLDNNYDFIYVSASFTIGKGTIIAWLDSKTKEYGQENPVLTYHYTGFMNGDNESVLDNVPYPTTYVNRNTAVGIYSGSITMTGGLDDKYTIMNVPANFTVTKANQSITFNALEPKTYGDESFILTATSNSGLTISYTCSNSDVAIVTGNKVSIIGAGTALITASQEGNDNYTAAGTVRQTLVVNQKPLSVVGTIVQSKVYDGNNKAMLSGSTLTGTINQDVIMLANTASGTFSQTDVGTNILVSTAMTISGDKVSNYVLSSPVLKADITAKPVTVKAKNASSPCDQAEQVLTYTFEPDLIIGDTFTGTLARTAGNTPGVYPISQGTLSLGKNYSINFIGSTYTITNAKNLAPVVDLVNDLKVSKNSKEVIVTLSGIDPVSNCFTQEIESITATAENKTLIPEILIEYTKGQPTAKLKITIADNQVGETKINVKLKDNGGTENNGVDTKEISFTINVEIPTGIEDLGHAAETIIYPNPSSGLINIETSGFVNPFVRIFKVTGEEILKKTKLTELIQTVNLAGNSPGLYFVEITDKERNVTKKLIIRK